jgi:FdhD protein
MGFPIAGQAASRVPRLAVRHGAGEAGERAVADEVPVAFTYNRATYAVMMASPADLRDFAYGFSRTEGVIGAQADILEYEAVTVAEGIELRLWLAPERLEAIEARRRHLAGPTGCGLCGIESLAEAARASARAGAGTALTPAQIHTAMAAMAARQTLGAVTRAAHAAGFWRPGAGLVAVREDVGRHNALDKLAGALLLGGEDAARGAVLLTSRVSVEMVQKSAAIGAAIVIAVSAPTALAIRTAAAANITLVAIAREDGFEVFTGAQRVVLEISDAL